MSETNNKSASQLYKESGSSLEFNDWLVREKLKGTFIKNDTVQSALAEVKAEATQPAKDSPDNSKFFGMNKTVLIVSLVIVSGAIIWKVSQKTK